MDILELEDVSKNFGALKVADEVSFSVPEGQALGIIGPNGAGKSTLFNLITGNFQPDSGRVKFLGQDVTKLPAKSRVRLGIGRSFQIPQPFESLTVFENLLTAAAFARNMTEAAVVDDCVELMELCGMTRRANTLAAELGLLDRKRLELARAVATSPKLLLLDEIAGGLTQGECAVLVETIKLLHGRGITVIWIEHVLHALNAVVEKLLVLNFGKMIATGRPDEIMSSREVREIYLGIEVCHA